MRAVQIFSGNPMLPEAVIALQDVINEFLERPEVKKPEFTWVQSSGHDYITSRLTCIVTYDYERQGKKA